MSHPPRVIRTSREQIDQLTRRHFGKTRVHTQSDPKPFTALDEQGTHTLQREEFDLFHLVDHDVIRGDVFANHVGCELAIGSHIRERSDELVCCHLTLRCIRRHVVGQVDTVIRQSVLCSRRLPRPRNAYDDLIRHAPSCPRVAVN